MHFAGPDQLHGFEERLTTDIYPSDHAWTPNWELPDERIDKWYHTMESVREAGMAATTFQIEYDEETAFFARRKIFEYAVVGQFENTLSRHCKGSCMVGDRWERSQTVVIAVVKNV